MHLAASPTPWRCYLAEALRLGLGAWSLSPPAPTSAVKWEPRDVLKPLAVLG